MSLTKNDSNGSCVFYFLKIATRSPELDDGENNVRTIHGIVNCKTQMKGFSLWFLKLFT